MKNQTKKLSTQPYKGSRDFYPQDLRIRDYIFGIWRKVCRSYGYEEYDGPYLEPFELYAAKSGEEIVNEQLYSFVDRGDRKIAIRPEMTPTVARMIAAKYKELTLPVRWFSIPNLWRYEKPQKGRLREFYQLNADIIGVNSIEADFEIISLAIDVMLEAGATKDMFELKINNRKLMDDFYKQLNLNSEQITEFNKALDKKSKITESEFENLLTQKVKLDAQRNKFVIELLSNPNRLLEEMLSQKSVGAEEVNNLLKMLGKSSFEKFVRFDPTIVRGLDYYTGLVFEQFDLNPENNRAMFGGGRYNDLIKIFIDNDIPATGFGMGDVTFSNFLESWGLMPVLKANTEILITNWQTDNLVVKEEIATIVNDLARKIRKQNRNVAIWLENNTKLDKQLRYADKNGIDIVLILGEEELKNKTITVKTLSTKKQETVSINKFLDTIDVL